MTWTRILAPLLALASLAPAPPAWASEPFLPVTSSAELSDEGGATEVGELIFRGGISIAPDAVNIGGISSLAWDDGELYAVTDDGRWMELTIDEIAAHPFYTPQAMRENLLIGDAAEVIEKLKKIEALGYDEFSLWIDSGMSFERKRDSLKRFIEDVMPAFA